MSRFPDTDASRTTLRLLTLASSFALLTSGCLGGRSSIDVPHASKPASPDTHSRFITTPIHDPASFARISRFRSGVGHDYSDDSEECRNMKHYFEPPKDVDWATVEMRVPFDGRITGIETEWAGDKVELVPDAAPDYSVVIFHLVGTRTLRLGDHVSAGEQLGHHVGPQTTLDVAVWHRPEGAPRRLLSYFEVLDDAAFEAFAGVGLTSRQATIITLGERDAAPLRCLPDGRFAQADLPAIAPSDWLVLAER